MRKNEISIGNNIYGRIIMRIFEGQNLQGNLTQMIGYRYSGEPKTINPMFCSIATFLRWKAEHDRIINLTSDPEEKEPDDFSGATPGDR